MFSKFKTLDPLLYILPLSFSVISLVFIAVLTRDTVGNALVLRQAIATVLGIIMMIVFSFLDHRAYKAWSLWIFIGMILSLVAVLVIGTTQFGAKSWIDVGPVQYQPGEFSKVLLPLVLAALLQPRGKYISWRAFILAALLMVVVMVLVLLQPDLGTMLVLMAIGIAIFLQSPLQKIQRIIVLLAIFFAVSSISLSFMEVKPFDKMLKPYQKDRLRSFVDPSADSKNSGYNVKQSKIAVGSGGVFGRGLGNGSQSQLNFLPVVHTDFIFAAISEAWGLVGSVGIIVAFLVLISSILRAAKISLDSYGSLLSIGFAAAVTVELLVNTGMNIGVMPVTGIPLPFISYGGTAVLTFYIMIGLVQSVVMRSKRLTF